MSRSRDNGYDLLGNVIYNFGKFTIICRFFLNFGKKARVYYT